MIITIDGPASSGKSTISNNLAKKLGFLHINSGLFYRALTYYYIKNKFENIEDILNEISFVYNGRLFLNGEDITESLRSKDIENNISDVAKNKLIRDFINDFMIKSFSNKDIIAEGRDMGTVFPKADLKVFLDASIKSRALRRFDESQNVSFEQIEKSIIKRDELDKNRQHGALKIGNSKYLDTTNYSIEEVILKIIDFMDFVDENFLNFLHEKSVNDKVKCFLSNNCLFVKNYNIKACLIENLSKNEIDFQKTDLIVKKINLKQKHIILDIH